MDKMKKHIKACTCDTCISARYWEPCRGCTDGHPSFWKTIVESKEWKAWEKVANEKGFDYDESRECGWFSPSHFKAFLEYTHSLPLR